MDAPISTIKHRHSYYKKGRNCYLVCSYPLLGVNLKDLLKEISNLIVA